MTGYGIRVGNDDPGLDPRKWIVKFLLGKEPKESL